MAQIKEPASYPVSQLAETVPEGGGQRNDGGGGPQSGPVAAPGREPKESNPYDVNPDEGGGGIAGSAGLTPWNPPAKYNQDEPQVDAEEDARRREQEIAEGNRLQRNAAWNIIDQGYTGAGKKGTGFENFNRYLGANMGAAKQAAEAWSKPVKEEGAQFETGMNESAGAVIDAAGKGVTGTGGGGAAPIVGEPTFQVNGQTLTRTQATELRGSLQNQINTLRQSGDNSTADSLQSVLDTMPSAKDLLGGGTQAAGTVTPETAKKLLDSGGYTGPTAWEGLQDLQSQAADIASRASQLGSFEGLASRSRELGSTTGGSILDAALLGSIGGRDLGEAGKYKELEKALGVQADKVGEAIQAGIKQGGENQEALQKALELYKKQQADAGVKGAGEKEKSWDEYYNLGEQAWSNAVSPGRMFESGGILGKGAGLMFDPVGTTIRAFTGGKTGFQEGFQRFGLGAYNEIDKAFGGKGNKRPTAVFLPDEKDVYESLSEADLRALELMPYSEQRAEIDRIKKGLRG